MKQAAVYILTSQRNGTLYVGVTSNLAQRVWQHKQGLVEGFTQRYGIKMLVWYELHESMYSAIEREKVRVLGSKRIKISAKLLRPNEKQVLQPFKN